METVAKPACYLNIRGARMNLLRCVLNKLVIFTVCVQRTMNIDDGTHKMYFDEHRTTL